MGRIIHLYFVNYAAQRDYGRRFHISQRERMGTPNKQPSGWLVLFHNEGGFSAADDKKSIPNAGKVDNPPTSGKATPAKAAPPAQDQPAPAKAEAPKDKGSE